MPVTTYFAAGAFDSLHFAKAQDLLSRAVAGGVVDTGLQVSIAPGTRKLAVSAGACLQASAYSESDSVFTVTLPDDDAGTNNRIDRIVLEVDWNAAKAAYIAAGGNGNVSTATAAARAAAGRITVVKGTPAPSPQPPTLVWNPGVKTQLRLARQLVRRGVGQIAASDPPVDERPLQAVDRSRPFVALNIPGNFTSPGTPLGVRREGDLVELSGRLTRTTSVLSAGTTTDFGGAAIVGPNFRPLDRQHQVLGFGATGGNALLKLVVQPDGQMTLTVLAGTLGANETFFVNTTTWIGA